MPDLHGLLLFIGAGIVLNLTPGVDMLYILGQAASRGNRAGIVATAGVCAGCSVHIAAATLGVSALLATSAAAFTALKLVGAAYLLYLGARLWLSTMGQRSRGIGILPSPTADAPLSALEPTSAPTPLQRPDRPAAVFAGGFLTNALNPKVALFFLAFLPQFIRPEADAKSLAMLGLGVLFVINSFIVNVLLVLVVSGLVRRVGPWPGAARWLPRLTGSLFICFGLKLLQSRNPA